ncbi:MAG TPA: hypothetical protein VGV38_21700, partial [Pyrinomonadaceae bacterium]|nr:hypothetical protein [Pyrinomonadaceae bacterium]
KTMKDCLRLVALLLCLGTAAHVPAQTARTRTNAAARQTRRAPSQPARTTDADNATRTPDDVPQQATGEQGRPAPEVSETEADLAITANVRARELTFKVVPEPRVEFTGRPERRTVWEAERENLPRPVRPGETYRDIGVRLRIFSVFADIERIVAEALGEVPVTDDAPPPQQQQPPAAPTTQPSPTPSTTTDATPATRQPTDTRRRP